MWHNNKYWKASKQWRSSRILRFHIYIYWSITRIGLFGMSGPDTWSPPVASRSKRETNCVRIQIVRIFLAHHPVWLENKRFFARDTECLIRCQRQYASPITKPNLMGKRGSPLNRSMPSVRVWRRKPAMHGAHKQERSSLRSSQKQQRSYGLLDVHELKQSERAIY